MSLAYQGVSAEDLLPQFRSTEDRYQTLWNAYIERMLRIKGALAKYPNEKVKHWLSWLAKQMIQESRTVFLIEKMQPTWLKKRSERIDYRISIYMLEGLIFGLMGGLILGLLNGGFSCIQHFNLRRILYQKGRIPWNYARFLDYVSERLLMKKVGGGYVFYHRMLMEHFARLEPD
jgi:predicted NACHT family NTPase